MGFITARAALLAEADVLDRKLMHLASPALDAERVMYLLTIGVVPHLQNQVSAASVLPPWHGQSHEVCCSAMHCSCSLHCRCEGAGGGREMAEYSATACATACWLSAGHRQRPAAAC